MICPHRRNPGASGDAGVRIGWDRYYKERWRVERTFAWLGNQRRLLVPP